MAIPHLKFIETLVISKFSVDGLIQKLEDYDQPIPEKAITIVYDTLRSQVPDYFRPSDPDPADPDWIREHDVVEGYVYLTNNQFPENTPSLDGAIKILNDPLMYRLITSMALALITEEDIELIVNGKYNMEYSSDDVKMFLKYFFNVAEWTLKERQLYVKSINEPQLRKYYKIALKGDKQHLLWKLGVTPEKDFSDMLRDIAQDSYYNFKEQSKIRPDVAQR